MEKQRVEERFVTVRDIAVMMGRSTNNVHQYIRRRREWEAGDRNLSHPMPAPVRDIPGCDRLWDRGEVAEWIETRARWHFNARARLTRKQSGSYPAATGPLLGEALMGYGRMVPGRRFAAQPTVDGKVQVELNVLITMDARQYERILNESRR